MKYRNQIAKYVTAVGLSVVAASAHAQVDTTAIETELNAMPGYMTLVGSALVLAAATAVGFKWIKGALFG